ncbi:MAG: hypothetical protein ACP5FH_02705 [Terracidiphilus sp.]
MKEKIGSDYDYLSFLVSRCRTAVKSILEQFEGQEGWAGRGGGCLCIADGETGFPLIMVLIGEVPLQKAPKYLSFCQEKAVRLASHRDHEASWESRDIEKNQLAGAVRFGEWILSFSGLPELGDEAAMLKTATLASAGFGAAAERIARRSDNPYWSTGRQRTRA